MPTVHPIDDSVSPRGDGGDRHRSAYQENPMFQDKAGRSGIPVVPLEAVLAAARSPDGAVGSAFAEAVPDLARRAFPFVFAASIFVHAAIALRLASVTSHGVRRAVPSQIEIEMVRPPPPPTPVVVPPQATTPPKAAPPFTVPPTPRPATSKPADRPPEALSDVVAPAADDGDLPPAAAEPAPVVVAAPAPPAPPPPIVQAKEGANYLKNPRPAYPHLAKRENWQGTVFLRVRVAATGRAGDVTVQTSSGHDVLDEAALEAVKLWTFVPATQGGQPVMGWVTVPIEFHLQ